MGLSQRWVKRIMIKAGIDMSFKQHSTRSAAASTANLHWIPINTITKTAGWSNARVFANYYEKPIHREASVQHAILPV